MHDCKKPSLLHFQCYSKYYMTFWTSSTVVLAARFVMRPRFDIYIFLEYIMACLHASIRPCPCSLNRLLSSLALISYLHFKWVLELATTIYNFKKKHIINECNLVNPSSFFKWVLELASIIYIINKYVTNNTVILVFQSKSRTIATYIIIKLCSR